MRKISVKKVMSILSTFIIGMSTMGCMLTNGITVKAETFNISNPRISEEGIVTWDKVEFGSYFQDVKGFEEQQIKWRILDIDGNGNAFLLADKALDCKPYNEKGVIKTDSEGDTYTDYSCTWETCSLRDWLNGTNEYARDDSSFIKAAFTDKERNEIISVEVTNGDNSSYNTPGGNNTMDKIYLLSIEEASSSIYGFDTTFNNSSKTREAKLSDFAKKNGAYRGKSSGYSSYIGNCYWWLRSPGKDDYVARVNDDGWGYSYGVDVDNDYSTVRPVLHVNLSSLYVTDAGKVTSDGNVTTSLNRSNSSQYEKPSISEGVTTWDCVYFGKYKQMQAVENRPIEWRVLSVNNHDVFLIADKALDCKQYNNTNGPCTWETCTLRDWLNGTDDYMSDDNAFINAAFTDEERDAIISTTVINEDNPSSNASGGNNTTDKIYLLSISEATNEAYGFLEGNKALQAKPTDYAIMNGAISSDYIDCFGNCYWWLRSPGNTSYWAADVNDAGGVTIPGYFAYVDNRAVRPVLHVDTSSSCIKYIGTVSLESKVMDDIDSQIGADEVIDLISSIGTVTKESKEAIEAARKAYNELSESAKLNVTNVSVLEVAETKLAEHEKQAKEEADKAEKEKQEITAASEVDRLIVAIGTVSANSKTAIDTARKTYNELSDGAKAKVTKLSVLETAEKTYADIENNTNNTGNNSDNDQNTDNQQASIEQQQTTQQPTSTEQPIAEEKAVVPAKAKISSVKNNKSKSFVAIWKKVKDAKGYEVQYALNKKFTKSKKTKAITSASKVSLAVKKLKKGKTYYVRVRAYNTDSKGSKAYGKWSVVKRVKIKK